MKKFETVMISLAMLSFAAPALAVDTTKVYSSGILVLVFLGICALFVVSQMIPAVILLFGMIKGLFKKVSKEEKATATEPVNK